MDWRGERCVLVTYAVRDLHKLSESDRELLGSLGFRLPSPGIPDCTPEHGPDWSGDAPPQVPCPLTSDDLQRRYQISSTLEPRSSERNLPEVTAPTQECSLGSYFNEPRVSDSGSLRVEPSSFIHEQVCSRRLSAPQAGLASVSSGLNQGTFELLSSLPPGRFVFSAVFPDLRSAPVRVGLTCSLGPGV